MPDGQGMRTCAFLLDDRLCDSGLVRIFHLASMRIVAFGPSMDTCMRAIVVSMVGSVP